MSKKIYKYIKSEERLMMAILTGEITWEQISNNKLPYEFLIKHTDNIVWEIYSANINNEIIVDYFKDYIEWDIFCSTDYFQKIVNHKFLIKYRKYISWEYAYMHIQYTDDIINDFFNEICSGPHLYFIFEYGLADQVSCESLDSLTSYFDKLTWNIVGKKHLDEWFIEKYAKQLNWNTLSRYQYFSESFMKKNIQNIKWNRLNSYCLCTVSDNFLRTYVVPNITDEYKVIELHNMGIIKLNMLKGTHLENAITLIKSNSNVLKKVNKQHSI